MANQSHTYYCEHCQKEYFFTPKEKKICPDCNQSLLSLECTKEDFDSYSKEEKDIVIESNLLKERKKREKQISQINNPYNDLYDEIKKISLDVTITKWTVIGSSILFFLIYIIEEIL